MSIFTCSQTTRKSACKICDLFAAYVIQVRLSRAFEFCKAIFVHIPFRWTQAVIDLFGCAVGTKHSYSVFLKKYLCVTLGTFLLPFIRSSMYKATLCEPADIIIQ